MNVPGTHRASPLARQAFAAYAALIVYASLYPFEGWVSLGIGPFDYLFAPMQRYVTAFDVVTNVLGYLPFGALGVLALHPRWRGVAATLIAGALGVLLSGTMEALQTYLPTRVASNLDLGANALGALLGAALAAPATGALLDRGALRRLRFAWLEPDGSTPLLLAALWPFAIVFPSPFLFGIGDWPAALWERADASMQDALLAWLPAAWRVSEWPERVDGWLSDSAWEAVLGGLMLFAALAIASLAMRARAAHPAADRAGGCHARAEGGRDVHAVGHRPRRRVGDARRAARHRARFRGGARRVARAGDVARAARGARAAGRRRAREPAAGQPVLRLHAVGVATGPLRALQQHRALARMDLALRGADLARPARRTRVAAGRAAPLMRRPGPCGGGRAAGSRVRRSL